MPRCMNTLVTGLFIAVHALFGQQLPPGVSAADIAAMPPAERAALESQAKAQGMSQTEIDALKKQYGVDKNLAQKPQGPADNTIQTSETEVAPGDSETTETPPVRATVVPGKLPYFGYDLFRTTPEAFKPTAAGPIDPGYLVGPGDVLRLSVWGQVEFQYELSIDLEGKIFIPVAGQVYVSGTPFEKLQEKIKNLLSRHYSGLATNPPRTFLDLSVAKLRPIRIFIMGEVQNPGGYTVSSYATAFNALYSVGGPLESGTMRGVTVTRNNKQIATVDLYDYLLAGACSTDVRLQNNDVVFVPKRGKTAAITGSVFRPAYYELRENEQLVALLALCGNVLTATNVDRAQVMRVVPFEERTDRASKFRVIDIDLKRYLGGKQDFTLYDRDSVAITPLARDLRNFVELSGAVQYPGLYQSDSVTLRSLVFDLGKPVADLAYLRRADLIRLNSDLVTTTVIPLDLEALAADPSLDQTLEPGDKVIVYEKSAIRPTDMTVVVEGEVNTPGEYHLDTNMTVTDAIIRAGGFTKKAFTTKVDVFRPNREGKGILSQAFFVDLQDNQEYAPSDRSALRLSDGDRIVVRLDPYYLTDNRVSIRGMVKYQGTYILEKRDIRLADIIEKAGGPLKNAYFEGAIIMRDGKRVVANVDDAWEKKKAKDNIILQKDDDIYIPPAPNNVYVHGQVNNPGLIGFSPGQSVRSYIDRAGGLADSVQCILFKKPNGETRKLGWFGNPDVPDGSEIVVLKKPAKPIDAANKGPSVAEVIRDTLAIITSAVTIVVLVAQLQK